METILDDYLAKVERYLKPLSASERVDIVKEMKSEILELQGEGETAEKIIERLGDPKELAKAYLGALIVRNSSFSWKRMLAVCAYYSLAGFSGLFIIPVLVVCAPVFIICGIASVVACAVKLLDSLLHLGIPYANYIVISGIENPIAVFVVSLVVGVILYLIGYGCWKLLIYYMKGVGKAREHLDAKI